MNNIFSLNSLKNVYLTSDKNHTPLSDLSLYSRAKANDSDQRKLWGFMIFKLITDWSVILYTLFKNLYLHW